MSIQFAPIDNLELEQAIQQGHDSKTTKCLNIDWTPVGKNWDPYGLLGSFRTQALKQGTRSTNYMALLDSICNEALSGDYHHFIVTLSMHTKAYTHI